MGDKQAEVRVRSEEHAARIVAALVHYEVPFSVKPEADGWWRIRAPRSAATPGRRHELDMIAASTAMPDLAAYGRRRGD